MLSRDEIERAVANMSPEQLEELLSEVAEMIGKEEVMRLMEKCIRRAMN